VSGQLELPMPKISMPRRTVALFCCCACATALNLDALKPLLTRRQTKAARVAVEAEIASLPATSAAVSISELSGRWRLAWSSQTADVNPIATADSVLGGQCFQDITLSADGCGRLDNVVEWAPRWRLVGGAAVEPAVDLGRQSALLLSVDSTVFEMGGARFDFSLSRFAKLVDRTKRERSEVEGTGADADDLVGRGWLECIFLQDDLRISRDNTGFYYIHERVPRGDAEATDDGTPTSIASPGFGKSRRAVVNFAVAAVGACLLPPRARVDAAALPVAVAARVADDLRRRADELRQDVAYPASVAGEWECTRELRRIEGDRAEAEATWRALGGGGVFGKRERYATRFIPIPDPRRKACVVDRGYEYAKRAGETRGVEWSAETPDVLRARDPTHGAGVDATRMTTIAVVRRDIEAFQSAPPYGFGYSELLRIMEGSSAEGQEGMSQEPTSLTVRAARLARRLAPTKDGEAIEGMEQVATYPTTDAAAAQDARPLSKITWSLRLTRRRAPL
jgi:hypothetical protein